MNRFLMAVIVLLLHTRAYAQNTPTPNEQFQQIFARLDKSVMTTGYLVNQQFSFAEPGIFQGNIRILPELILTSQSKNVKFVTHQQF